MATRLVKTLGADPPEYVDPYAEQIAQMQARMAQQQAPMYTPEQVQQRRGENDMQYQLGLLAQLSGDQGLGNVGGTIFKQALAQRAPRVTERGVADPITGEFKYNTDFLRERDEGSLAALQKAAAEARGKWDDKRLSAQERDERDRKHMEALAAIRANSGGGQVGAYQQAGFTPDGQQVVTGTKSGVNYVVKLNADGSPSYTPYSGQMTPKTTWDKAVVEAQENLGAADRADKLIKQVEKNPDAFGIGAATVSAFPGPMQGWVAPLAGLSREQRNLRAQVTRDAAMELNKIYGAAQSAGELARASAWAPNATDDFETTMTKLSAARDWARQQAGGKGKGVMDAARGRTGGASGEWDEAPAGGSGGALSDADKAELQQLRQRFKR